MLLALCFRCAQRLLSEVVVSVSLEDKAVSRYWVSVTPLCPDGSTAAEHSCTGVQPDQTVNTQQRQSHQRCHKAYISCIRLP